MKRIKYLILIFVLLLFTGCSVDYNLTINNDMSVNETITATDSTRVLKMNTGLDEDKSVEYLYNIYKKENIESTVSKIEENGKTIATVNYYFDTIDDYVDNFTSDVVKEASYTKDGSLVTLVFKQTEELSTTAASSLPYDRIRFTVDVPYTVTYSNADSIRNNTNYIWNISKNEELKTMKITFDTSKEIGKTSIRIGNHSVGYVVLIIIGLLLIIGIICLVVYRKNKKNNSF